ncbi:site-specific DNA-methyltransferase [Xanthomonas sp. NCPPB 3005]|uniref:DNA-methyltransferase n=1 Tax=Xanthomonas sp. NCPPB 3005 TaxID=3240913 RepID=UPI0035110C2E
MIHVGDCLEVMRGIAADSVDAIVTDPPYGLSFMGKHWDYDVPSVEVWAECLRVLKPGGHLLAFAGTRTQHRMAVRIEDAGFEIRDMIAWIYGSGFPKSHNLAGAHEGWGTALKPALEPITVARKPLSGTVAANVLAHGTGALNIDECRVGWPGGVAPEIGTPGWGGPAKKLTAVPGQDGETVERSTPSQLGRWPANLIHDGSEEVLAAFPAAKGQQGDLRRHAKCRQSRNGIFGGMRPALDHFARIETETSAARFFYCAKASKADRDAGLVGFETRAAGMVSNTSGQHMTRRDEGYEVTPRANNHPTVKPTDLMRYLCRLVTPAGGLVLDPFMGSGSTGRGAVLEGFRFVGIELDPAYAAIAEARIAAALATKAAADAAPQQHGLQFGDAA